MNERKGIRVTGPRQEVKGGEEAMLAQLQEGWKEIMGAPDNVSHRASNRSMFPEISVCITSLRLLK